MKKTFIGMLLLGVITASLSTGCGMQRPAAPPKPPGAPAPPSR
ncbi:hypothetical protein [Mucilaginibacter myungsuensis]|nr:hypothetical protein [Mucilaginibacter myungsuensis]MDN3597103.1 hypothetical protein [Mucilaginibacter myungsuensis]